jgi:hypothetical protein
MDLIADTSYLVGLWRGQPWAKSHAATNASKSLVTRNRRHFGMIPALRTEVLQS